MRHVRYSFASICAGGLMWASFPDVGWWMLIVPALALMLGVVDSVSSRVALVHGALFGAVFWFPHVAWAQIAANGGPLPWIALASTQVVAWAIWAAGASSISRLPWARTVRGYVALMAVAWVGLEQLRSHVPFSGFPWGNIAYPHVDAPAGHLAPLGGETLVSLVVVAVAALLRLAVSARQVPWLSDHWWSRVACVITACAVYTAPMLVPTHSAQEQGSVRVAAIQGFVEVPGFRTYGVEGHVTANHVRVTRDFLASGDTADVIIWGEGALDRDPRTSRLVHDAVASVAAQAQVPLLVGFTEYDRQAQVTRNWYGTWNPDGGLAEPLYGKQVPVPFGEYIPFRDFISSLATEAAQVRVDMQGVDNSSRYDVALPDGRVLHTGVGICFEVAYERLWAEAVRSGAQILVAPSNNYHFRTSPEPAQQAQMARFRALEFSRSAVQVSTTGESVMIRPDGGVRTYTPRHAPAYIVGDLPLRSTITWAAYTAQPLAWVVEILWGCALVSSIIWRAKLRRTST